LSDEVVMIIYITFVQKSVVGGQSKLVVTVARVR